MKNKNETDPHRNAAIMLVAALRESDTETAKRMTEKLNKFLESHNMKIVQVV